MRRRKTDWEGGTDGAQQGRVRAAGLVWMRGVNGVLGRTFIVLLMLFVMYHQLHGDRGASDGVRGQQHER